MSGSDKLCLLVCSNLYTEFSCALEAEGIDNVELTHYPSNCDQPHLTQASLQQLLDRHPECTHHRILGSRCLAHLSAEQGNDSPQLHMLEQCFYPFIDPEQVNHWLAMDYLLMTPGWLNSWRDQVTAWGVTEESAPAFFRGHAKKLLLLDTTTDKDSAAQLAAFSAYSGLEAEVKTVGLGYLQIYLSRLILEWRLGNLEKRYSLEIAQLRQDTSTYAMAIDLLNSLTGTMRESQAVERITEIFSMMFAAERVYYRAAAPATPPGKSTGEHSGHNKPYKLTTDGFQIHIDTSDATLGWMVVERLVFPEHREQYLNLALTIAGVCGLAIENARTYQMIKEVEEALRASNSDLSLKNSALKNTLEQLHATQKQLVEAEKMASLGVLVAGVSHEINTPVGVCTTAVSSLSKQQHKISTLFGNRKMKQSDLEQYLATTRQVLELTQNNLHRIGELVKGFKQVAVTQHSDNTSHFPIKTVLENSIRSLGSRLREPDINIGITCDSNLEIDSYPGAFSQIFINLLSNSLDHGLDQSDNGQITIDITLREQQVRIDYRDNGSGISPDILPKIFDPFFTTNMQDGTGLGLNIVYNLVTQKLYGIIRCRSTPDEGVHFIIELPNPIPKDGEIETITNTTGR